jgi:hypothetical protein
MTCCTPHRWGCVYVHLNKSNKFVAVVVVFQVANKLPHFSNGAGAGPTFEVCLSSKLPLPILGN